MRLLLISLLPIVTAEANQGSANINIMSDGDYDDAISTYNKKLIQTTNIDLPAYNAVLFTIVFRDNTICGLQEQLYLSANIHTIKGWII